MEGNKFLMSVDESELEVLEEEYGEKYEKYD